MGTHFPPFSHKSCGNLSRAGWASTPRRPIPPGHEPRGPATTPGGGESRGGESHREHTGQRLGRERGDGLPSLVAGCFDAAHPASHAGRATASARGPAGGGGASSPASLPTKGRRAERDGDASRRSMMGEKHKKAPPAADFVSGLPVWEPEPGCNPGALRARRVRSPHRSPESQPVAPREAKSVRRGYPTPETARHPVRSTRAIGGTPTGAPVASSRATRVRTPGPVQSPEVAPFRGRGLPPRARRDRHSLADLRTGELAPIAEPRGPSIPHPPRALRTLSRHNRSQ